MKIILTSRVSGLGNVGDIVNVKNGYAKNFLIPSQKAICHSVNNEVIFSAKKDEYEKASKEVLDIANQAKKQFVAKNLVIVENASDDGRLYGSVNSAVISAQINKELGSDVVSKVNIILNKPIKEIGVYDVKVDIHCDVDFTVKLVVCRLESDVESLLKNYEKSKKQALKQEDEDKKSDKEIPAEVSTANDDTTESAQVASN